LRHVQKKYDCAREMRFTGALTLDERETIGRAITDRAFPRRIKNGV